MTTETSEGISTTGPKGAAPVPRHRRVGAVAGYHLLVWRRTLVGSVFSRFVGPVLFLLAMGVGLGSLVDQGSGGVDGTSYLLFVAPAMFAVQGMMDGANESMWPVYGYLEWNRMYLSMIAAPLTVGDVLLGHLLVIAAQSVAAGVAYLVVAALFGAVVSWWALLCVPVGVLVCLAVAAPLFGVASRARTDNVFNVVMRLAITPLMLFSGVFFPVDSLPVVLQALAWVTPLWHGVELSRDAAHGVAGSMDAVHLLVLLAFVGAGWVWARRGLSRRLVA